MKAFGGGSEEARKVNDLLRTINKAYRKAVKEAKQKAIAEDGVSSVMDAAKVDGIGKKKYNIRTEADVEKKLRNDIAKERRKKRPAYSWTDEQVDEIVGETKFLIESIDSSLRGNSLYDEWADREPTLRTDWRDGKTVPVVTWSRNNIEYKYDVSADLLCVNNKGMEEVLSSEDMVDLMGRINMGSDAGFTSDDYMRLYETMRDLGLNVPCRGCFDAAPRMKMLSSVARNFADEVNAVVDERNADPEKFDNELMEKANGKKKRAVNGLPVTYSSRADAIRAAVAGDGITEHIDWRQLMSADGQTSLLAKYGGLFRAWQKTGAGRPKDKLLPEPYTGALTSQTTTIIAPYGKKTPPFRTLLVNQGTSLRRNSHTEMNPLLAIDEIQFMRDAYAKNLMVFKYMKELVDVRLFGNMGVKYNMSFFPAYDKNSKVAGLDNEGNYIASEESVGSREFAYIGEDGKQHFDGMRGLEEAQKYVNADCSLSTVVFSIPHLIKVFTDVPTSKDRSGKWGSAIPFHASGATAHQLAAQGLGSVRAILPGTFEEAYTDYGKGVTNFEDVQNDRFGKGWTILEGVKAGTEVAEGHKLEFANGSHYYNEGLGVHLFSSWYVNDAELSPEELAVMMGDTDMSAKQRQRALKQIRKDKGHDYSIDYNDKVRAIGGEKPYEDAATYYIENLPKIGLIPRFDFRMTDEQFKQMCADAHVDPHHPKLGWVEGNGWSPIDSDAYYSLFCDYGMVDPKTGKYAPQRPVGYIDADGNRSFRMPENTAEIIKEGVDQYTRERNREKAMHDDVMREYVKRTVEDGKLTEEEGKAFLEEKGIKYSLREDESSGEEEMTTDDGKKYSLREEDENEKVLRDVVIDHLNEKNGIQTSIDHEAGQRVLDMAREEARLEAARHKSKEAEERDEQLRAQDLATALVTGKTEKEVRAERRRREQEFKKETKELYDRVLSGNFDDVTLRLIDDYINKVTPNNYYGRPLSKRLPQRVGQKVSRREQTSSVDALFSRICEGTVGANERTRPEAKRRIEEKKKELLKGWAIATGNWHTSVNDFTNATEPFGGGKDSDVYMSDDGNYVIKVSKGKDDLKRFRPDMDNVALFNYIFPNSSYDIIGYGEVDGKFVRFLRQPFVDFTESTPLSVEERVAYMEHLGFKPINKEKTAFSNGEIVASDIQGNNIVKDKQGNIRVIDADMRFHTKDVGGKYAYPPVEKDTELNQPIIREHRVYHGSGADFEEFDHSHMGEGEGLQIHGYGTYVSVAKGMAEGYARKLADDGESSNLYTVEIPDNKGSNYLEEDQTYAPDNALREKVNAALEKRGLAPLGDEDLTGRRLYREVKNRVGSKKAASELLGEIGLNGVHYFGQTDGECYVIFNEKDAKITDHVRFFKTKDGEAYGFTVGGRIYIDPRIANAETPIHEYAHLWSSALKKNNPKEWKNVVGLMKNTSVWEEVKKTYPELKTDDEIADEVLSTYSGRRGAERLREEARKIASGDGTVMDKAKAVSALQKVKEAIDRFWKTVADFLHIHYTSAEQVADQVMKDLVEGVDPRKASVEEQQAEADGVKYSLVEDKNDLDRLEHEKTVKAYRAMVMIDGKLYPPMSSKDADGKLRNAVTLGKWEQADEAPDKAVERNGKWVFPLKKDNGKMLYAAYNPYIHSSRTMLNDQFSEAHNRDNLVVVEVEVPESELTSGYRAEKAKDGVGVMDWKAGIVQGQLTGKREVILSRWDKPVRVVPTEEVAESIAEMLKGKDVVMPSNVVTKDQRAALEKLGVPFVETTSRGVIVDGEHAGETYSSVYGKKAKNAAGGKRYSLREDSERESEPRTLKGDEALTALDNIFEGPTNEKIPKSISTLEHFKEVFKHPIRTFLGEIVRVKDEVFNKIIREKRSNISGAVLPTIEKADFAIRDTDGSTLYVKRFKSNNSGNTYNIVVVNKHGDVEDYVSSVHIKHNGNLRNKIKNGAELLLPQERNTDGTLSRNNSTPTAKVENNSESSNISDEKRGKKFSLRT